MSGEQSERPTAERITLAISIFVLAAIVILIGWSHYRTGDSPPAIEVQVHLEQVRVSDERFYVPVTITNNGGLTGQDVIVTGELDTGEGQPESADVTLTFLAGGESEEAELIFTSDPSEGELTVGATSFTYP